MGSVPEGERGTRSRSVRSHPACSRVLLFVALLRRGAFRCAAVGLAVKSGKRLSGRWLTAGCPRSPIEAEQDRGAVPDGMVWIPGGTFRRGSDEESDAQPVREIEIDGFWMDRTEVTNAQFAAFVSATGYVTVAEQPPDPRLFPDAPASCWYPARSCSAPPRARLISGNRSPGGDISPERTGGIPKAPAARSRAERIIRSCTSAGMTRKLSRAGLASGCRPRPSGSMPRGALERKQYAWGDEFRPGGQWRANTWQGRFPAQNTGCGWLPDDGAGGVIPAQRIWAV